MFTEFYAPRGCGYRVADYESVQNELYRARHKIKCLLKERSEYEHDYQVMRRELDTCRETIVSTAMFVIFEFTWNVCDKWSSV